MGLILTILEAIPGLGTLVRVFFPSADRQLGRTDQAAKDQKAANAAEKAKDETAPIDDNGASDSLHSGTF